MDDDIRRHYLAKHMPAPVRQRLEEAWQQSQEPPARRSWIRPRYAAAAAVLLAGLLVGLAVLTLGPRDSAAVDHTEMATALVELHQLRNGLAVESQDFAQINAALGETPFELIDPQQLINRGYRLNGARLAELQGETAAVLSMTCPEGYAASLIQIRGGRQFEPLEIDGLRHNGLRIKMWMDGSVFCCFVETVPTAALAQRPQPAPLLAGS